MPAEKYERFQLSNNCWICDKLNVGGDEVRDHCQTSEKYSAISAIPKYSAISAIPNGLRKYMAFTINKNLVFIDSMQFMNFSLDSLVKNLSDNDFEYLPEEFMGEFLKLVK